MSVSNEIARAAVKRMLAMGCLKWPQPNPHADDVTAAAIIEEEINKRMVEVSSLAVRKKGSKSGGWKNEPTRQAATRILNDPDLLARAYQTEGRGVGQALKATVNLRLKNQGTYFALVDWGEIERMVREDLCEVKP